MKRTAQELCDDAGVKTRSYSGRGMYGKTCLAIEIPRSSTLGEVLANLLEVVEADPEDPEHTWDDIKTVKTLLRKMRSDSMGLGQVLYFPGIEFTGTTDDLDDDDDDLDQ